MSSSCNLVIIADLKGELRAARMTDSGNTFMTTQASQMMGAHN